MAKFIMDAKSFKKMENPNNDLGCNRYIFYAKCSTIPEAITEWKNTNPREQNLKTGVVRKILESLNFTKNFHELNRGILFSAESVSFDNKTNKVTIDFLDNTIHGNIDGGHTLHSILKAKKDESIEEEQWVLIEVFVGLDYQTVIQLAESRNTSVQVDTKSIQELKKSFEKLKESLKDLSFANRIQYKMNEHKDKKEIIDIREIIAIIMMFSQEIYPKKNTNGKLNELHPIQSYSGKASSLNKFIEKDTSDKDPKNGRIINNMSEIIPTIFELYELIEVNFAKKLAKNGKKYGVRKYSKYDNGKHVAKSLFEQTNLTHYVPRGIMYPLLGAFRALIEKDEKGKYSWKIDPKQVWEDLGTKLATTIYEEKIPNPDALAKNNNLWANLFQQIYIYAYI